MKKEDNILKSWEANASEWIQLLEKRGIASRKITNKAIVECIHNSNPDRILDLGCGEGWLTRALSVKTNSVTGIDAIESLLEQARTKGEQDFYKMTYEEIIEGKKIPGSPYDAIVLNFCLYQDKQVEELLKSVTEFLKNNGQLFIQSIHPYFLIQNQLEYKSQWIENSWKGLSGNFVHPHSWFARTFEDWINLFHKAGLSVKYITEPLNEVKNPVSVIFNLRKDKSI